MSYLTELSDEHQAMFRAAYKTFANDKELLLTKDIAQIMRSLGYYPNNGEIKAILEQHDPEQMDWIDMTAWLTIMNDRVKMAKETEESIIEAFRVFDKNANGFLPVAEIRHILMTLGDVFTDEEMTEMLLHAPIAEKDGTINYEEFVAKMGVSTPL